MSGVTVYLVGAGPGDPGLVTVRGREVLSRADVVVYDYLANPALLDLAPEHAERVYVGKKGFERHITQDEVNEVLVDAAERVARRGGVVVRLKGGDPYLFGRGGEEALALFRAGIAFEVVPGVTSGIAAPAYAGVPVTHRGIASSVTFVTGHEDPAKRDSAVDWAALARLVSRGGTVCFYMGMKNLPVIAGNLQREGAAPDVPVAVVHRGTEARQRTVVATLGDVAAAVEREGLGAPSMIVVGQVVRLRAHLAWFERRSLHGRRIVVTRSRAQASGLVAQLSERGAEVLEFPSIEIAPPSDYRALDEALGQIASYDWVVFTSANGVDAFFDRLPGDARLLAGALVAAIGPATADRLARHGIVADAVPAEYRGEAVFGAMAGLSASRGAGLRGARVLVPRAEVAREALPGLLRDAGAHVDVVAAYRTVVARTRAGELACALADGSIDAVTFTSSSTARNLVELLGEDAGLLGRADLCSIGPVTSQALRELGFEPAVEAREYTVDGLVSVICDRYGKEASQ